MPLNITIPEKEYYRENPDGEIEFWTAPKINVKMEHSLYSVSKWEMKWRKSFLENSDKLTYDEELDYFKCMTITPQDIEATAFKRLGNSELLQIREYINNPMTATTIKPRKNKKKTRQRQIVTNEVIYGWMAGYQIPFDCDKWHLNRLMTLIGVCAENNAGPDTKMTKKELTNHYKDLNARNRARFNSKG